MILICTHKAHTRKKTFSFKFRIFSINVLEIEKLLETVPDVCKSCFGCAHHARAHCSSKNKKNKKKYINIHIIYQKIILNNIMIFGFAYPYLWYFAPV